MAELLLKAPYHIAMPYLCRLLAGLTLACGDPTDLLIGIEMHGRNEDEDISVLTVTWRTTPPEYHRKLLENVWQSISGPDGDFEIRHAVKAGARMEDE